MKRLFLLAVAFVALSGTLRGTQLSVQRPNTIDLLLTGGVQMQIGSLEIRADQVDASRGPRRLVASGNVVVTRRGDRIAAPRLAVPPTASTLVVAGDVVVVVDGIRLMADRVEIDPTTGALHASTVEIVVENP